MLLVSYDISHNKLRTQFAKFLSQYGGRLQYSLFEIKNSPRILSNIELEIKNRFEKQFQETDSIMIISLSQTCNITKYGYAKHIDEDLIIL